jgi:hypothetical protein
VAATIEAANGTAVANAFPALPFAIRHGLAGDPLF